MSASCWWCFWKKLKTSSILLPFICIVKIVFFLKLCSLYCCLCIEYKHFFTVYQKIQLCWYYYGPGVLDWHKLEIWSKTKQAGRFRLLLLSFFLFFFWTEEETLLESKEIATCWGIGYSVIAFMPLNSFSLLVAWQRDEISQKSEKWLAA